MRLHSLRENASLQELQTAKECAPTRQGFVRFLTIELLLKGQSKEVAAQAAGRSVRQIERWVSWYEERGIDGLALKGRSGRPRKISKERFGTDIVPLVLEPAKVGETCFTGVKLHGYLVKELRGLKRDFFTSWFAKTPDELEERTVTALCSYIDNPSAITSIANHSKSIPNGAL